MAWSDQRPPVSVAVLRRGRVFSATAATNASLTKKKKAGRAGPAFSNRGGRGRPDPLAAQNLPRSVTP
jgi:hypothetical protein